MLKSEMFQRSWMLFRTSLRTLREHRKLLAFPCVAILAFAAGFAPVVIFFREVGKIKAGTPNAPLMLTMLPLGLLGEFMAFLMLSLMVGAFYHECPRALSGEPVSFRRGFRAALSRIRILIVWHLFSALAAYLTRLVAGQFGIGGKIAEALVGLGWGAASFFVIPIVMREPKQKPDPLGLVKKSASLVQGTWGESISGSVGLSILAAPVVVVMVAVFLLARGVFGTAAAAYVTPAMFFSGPGLLLIAVLILWTLAISLAGAVYRSALYVYATEGVVPEPFDRTAVEGAWRVKKGTGP